MSDWFGSLPHGWSQGRLKNAVDSLQSGAWGDEPTGGSDDILCVRVADFDRPKMVVGEVATLRSVPEKDRSHRLLLPGDILLEKSGGTDLNPVGFTVMFDGTYPAVTSNFVSRLRVKNTQSPRFWLYALAASYATRRTERAVRRTTGIQNLDQKIFLDEVFPFPPLDAQRAIADYLDRETAQIDTLISEQQRMRGLLSERRRGLIERWVFGWHAAQKADFGYPWLPPLPIHWSTPSIGQVCETLAGWAFRSEGFTDDSNAIRLLRGVNVKAGRIDWSEMVAWSQEAHPVPEDFVLQEGDLVFGMDRPFVSTGVRVAAVTSADLPAYLVQRVMRIRPGADLDAAYLAFLMETDSFNSYLAPLFTGVSVPHVSEWQVRKFRIPLPPLDEQHSAVRSLRREIEIIEQLDQEADTLIRLARERRAALITAAVTGQIEIPEAS